MHWNLVYYHKTDRAFFEFEDGRKVEVSSAEAFEIAKRRRL